MSAYTLQKLIRRINTDPDTRQAFAAEPERIVRAAGLEEEEINALCERDYGALYRLGVHGLLLRPFSLIHSVAEQDYLTAIRESKS